MILLGSKDNKITVNIKKGKNIIELRSIDCLVKLIVFPFAVRNLFFYNNPKSIKH